jgi:hypothetical protein
MLVGAAIDRGDGDSGIKGAIIGSIAQTTVRLAVPLVITYAVGWGVLHLAKRALNAIDGEDHDPAEPIEA